MTMTTMTNEDKKKSEAEFMMEGLPEVEARACVRALSMFRAFQTQTNYGDAATAILVFAAVSLMAR